MMMREQRRKVLIEELPMGGWLIVSTDDAQPLGYSSTADELVENLGKLYRGELDYTAGQGHTGFPSETPYAEQNGLRAPSGRYFGGYFGERAGIGPGPVGDGE